MLSDFGLWTLAFDLLALSLLLLLPCVLVCVEKASQAQLALSDGMACLGLPASRNTHRPTFRNTLCPGPLLSVQFWFCAVLALLGGGIGEMFLEHPHMRLAS